MQPILNNVLVKPYPPLEVSEGGIIVPENARQENNKVFIVAVGKGTKKKPMTLNPGESGFRVKSWGTEVIINGEKHYLMDQSAVLAKV